MSPQIQKQQFKNETGGWIGAVQLTARGDERGVAVESGGTVWLSEAEQILTANAPRQPKDNPFLEQTLIRTDPETGASEEYQVTPLIPVSEDRFVPANERPIPSDLSPAREGALAQATATGEEPVVPVVPEQSAATREEEIIESGEDTKPHEAPKVPQRAAAAASAASGDEETAAASPGPESEETGAALPPQGPAHQGAFGRSEEVGTPDAPGKAPAPYTPPER